MVMHPFLLATALTATLILQSGQRIPIDGPLREERGMVTFRSGGALYSIAAAEVHRVDEPAASTQVASRPTPPPESPAVPRLRVSAEERKRLLEELEQNHGGTPAPRQKILEEVPPAPTAAERRMERAEESDWRRRARMHEENLLRAEEDLALIESRIRELESKIWGLVALGYQSHQFTYDTRQLVLSREQIPAAQLRVSRAQRALSQFRDDARREGIPPGWLR